MAEKKCRHLTMLDRRIVEDRLRDKVPVGAIAKELGVDWATVAREIKRHRTPDSRHYRNFGDRNLCRYKSKCVIDSLCAIDCAGKSCARCDVAQCWRICDRFEPDEGCPRLEKAPYCCNGCKARLTIGCDHESLFYDADVANEEAEHAKTASRQGVDCTPEQLADMVATIKPLLKKGQSLEHIWQTHHAEFPVSFRTFYRYVSLGVLDVCNLDLPKKVKYKPRKKARKGEAPFRAVYEGRTFDVFKALPLESRIDAVEMDCVESGRGCDKAILTLLLRRFNFQIMVMLPAQTQECVKAALDKIEMLCGTEEFERVFGVLLTDRGIEFRDWKSIERGIDGEKRCSVYYCDALRSNQKGKCEKNHVELRKILPSGTSLERITDRELSVICSHVNSYTRPKLGGAAPYDLAALVLPKDLLDGLGIVKVPPDDVIMRPSLLKELGLR